MVLYIAPTYLDIVQHDRLHFSFYVSFGATIIGVGAGKSLGVQGNFPQFPQTCPKTSKEYDIQKQTTAFHWAKRTSRTIFAQNPPKLSQISPNLLENNRNETWLRKNRKVNHFTFILPAIFEKWTHRYNSFCEGWHIFCQNFLTVCPMFREFCPDYYQFKTFGGAVAPLAPPPPTAVATNTPMYCNLNLFTMQLPFTFISKRSVKTC